jgi:hypothetical protein
MDDPRLSAALARFNASTRARATAVIARAERLGFVREPPLGSAYELYLLTDAAEAAAWLVANGHDPDPDGPQGAGHDTKEIPMLNELRQRVEDYDATPDGDDSERVALVALAECLRAGLDDPAVVQALALAPRMRTTRHVTIAVGPFDLPSGYWLARFDDGFECGIAPDGAVSS